MFWLESGPLTSTTTSVVYLCRPLIRNIKIVAGKSPIAPLDCHPRLIVSPGRPDQETREGVPETRAHSHTYPTRFYFGQSDPGGGRRSRGGQYLLVQSTIYPTR